MFEVSQTVSIRIELINCFGKDWVVSMTAAFSLLVVGQEESCLRKIHRDMLLIPLKLCCCWF